MKKYATPIPSDQAWPRAYLVRILEAGMLAKEYNFTRQTALAWLASYPGDLPVKLIQAKAMVLNGLSRQAFPILQHLVRIDPEFLEARELLYKTNQTIGHEVDQINLNSILALGGPHDDSRKKFVESSSWGLLLAKTRQKYGRGDLEIARNKIQQFLGQAPNAPLGGITHLLILRAQKDTPWQSIRKLAEHYHQKWPECLQIILILAESLIKGSDSVRAVALLHSAASKDVTGQVASRLWGPDHPYRNLWPNQLKAYIHTQIPSSVAAYMGWNLLPMPVSQGENGLPSEESPADSTISETNETESQATILQQTSSGQNASENSNNLEEKEHQKETVTSIKEELAADRNRTKSVNADGLFPVYVIFSTMKGLQKKYGVETTSILDEAMRKLITAIRKRLDWGATLIYADDPTSMAQYGLKPALPDDPWKLKLALVDLDDALAKRGARIGAVLIIGDSQVVPFHNLPNPTDDSDAEVPSDNPYATRDENYFIPEWPVGRLPGGSGKDPGLLISVLRKMTEYHSNTPGNAKTGISVLLQWLINLIRKPSKPYRRSIGYSTEIWKEISGSIYRTIGDSRSLMTSPPDEAIRKKMLPNTRLGYFNLHGVSDSAEWFGQRDPRNPAEGPEYPVALQPNDIPNGGSAPQVVFSEACYGANIYKKSIEDALALKFLASGSQAVIGSTVVSYGSVKPPLNAADLLGNAFWKNFKDGLPVGEALRRSKITLASEMHERQGFLDGEDQKTLISFVLYGDPLAQEKDLKNWHIHKSLSRANVPPEIKTVCDRVDIPGTSEPISREMIGQIKNIVEQYLPGMRDAQISLSKEHAECCCEGHICPTRQLGTKTRLDHDPNRQVVTLSKHMVRAHQIHESFARVTLDNEGNLVKLTVSR